MALVFQNRNVATLRAKSTEGNFINVPGVTPDETNPVNYPAQVNKILAVGGKAIVADLDMTVEMKKGVIDDGQ
ncbi:MAG: hypothetical protein IJK81_06990 [Selenomonadaceae bacterium]|nr:hypothetical protein [Selenomonadaceae bacterium]